MRELGSTLQTVGAAVALALAMMIVTSVTPTEVAAQCSGCVFTGSGQECGEPSSDDRCEGGNGKWCAPCGDQYASVPTDLGLDGTFLAPLTTVSLLSDDIGPWGETLSPGVTVLRSACSGVITSRHYTDEAAKRARRATAALAFK